jgi:uncharacterized LabA/DUF88 family protein
MKSFRNMAVFIDGDNISHDFIPFIMNKLNKKGRVILKRVYGDFSKDNLKPWINVAKTHNLALKQVDRLSRRKNNTDIGLIIDAIDTIHTTPLDQFCLISGDIDYLQLIQFVKSKGIKTLGVAGYNKNKLLEPACDEFWNIQDEMHSLSKKKEKQQLKKENLEAFKCSFPVVYKIITKNMKRSFHKSN